MSPEAMRAPVSQGGGLSPDRLCDPAQPQRHRPGAGLGMVTLTALIVIPWPVVLGWTALHDRCRGRGKPAMRLIAAGGPRARIAGRVRPRAADPGDHDLCCGRARPDRQGRSQRTALRLRPDQRLDGACADALLSPALHPRRQPRPLGPGAGALRLQLRTRGAGAGRPPAGRGLDLHHRHARRAVLVGARAARRRLDRADAGARGRRGPRARRRGRQPRQVGIPRQYEPRAAHAAETGCSAWPRR